MGELRTLSQIIFVLFIAFSYASDKDEALVSKFQELEVENTETPRVEKKVELRKVLTGNHDEETFIRELFKDEQFNTYYVGIAEKNKAAALKRCLKGYLSGDEKYSMIVDKDTKERVGIGSLDVHNGRYYFALGIAVGRRRQGYGAAVVKEYIQHIMSEKGVANVWAMSENPVMQKLLKKLNFLEVSVTDYNQAPKQKHFVFDLYEGQFLLLHICLNSLFSLCTTFAVFRWLNQMRK